VLKLDDPMSMKRPGRRTRGTLVFPSPPLKFRTSGLPRYGFKLRFRGDLQHRTRSARRVTAYYGLISASQHLPSTYVFVDGSLP
jgi:hypothetical protein